MLLGLVLLLGGCDSSPAGPGDGSETHFLGRCHSQAACGEGFECLCGACTKACSEAQDCGGLAAETAACIAVAARPEEVGCTDAPVAAFCDVQCSATSNARPAPTVP
jgi:polyhydroxybutyrate depolymerase